MKISSLKQTLQNSYYGKMLFLYSSVFLLSSIIMTSILFYSQHKNQLEVQKKNSQSALAQFQMYTDHYILDQIYDVVNNKLFNNTLNNDNILFNSDSYVHDFNDFEDILDIHAFFSDIAQNSSVIQSIYVYHKKNDTFVSTDKGCFYFITDRRFDYQSILPYPLLDYADRQTLSQFWIPPAVTSSFRGNDSNISLVITLPTFTDPENAELFLFVNLDLASIYKEYLHDMDTSATEILVLSGQEDILYSTAPGRFQSGSLPAGLSDTLAGQPHGSDTVLQNGSRYTVSWMSSSTNNWKYVYLSLSPNLFVSVFSSAGGIFLISLAVSFLCLMGVYFISKWLYRPIGRLVKYSRQSAHVQDTSQPHTDELSALDAAFRNMSGHIDRLQQVVDKNNSLLISNTIKDLISGGILSHRELNERLALTGEAFPFPYFYLLCIKIDESAYAGLDYQKKAFLQISVIDLLNTHSFESVGINTKCLSVFHHSGDFTTVINADSREGFPEEVLTQLLAKLSHEYGDIFNMAVSPAIMDFADFQAARTTLSGYFKYSYLYGSHNIFTRECIAEYESNAMLRAQAPLKILTSQIKKHDNKAIKQEIAALFQQSRQGKNSLLYTYNLSLQIINLICNECDSLGIHTEELSHPYLVNSFTRIQNLEDTIDWFYQVTDLFTSLRESHSSALDATVIPNILEYMESHVDQQLSLNSVADHFGISSGHLSRLFKEKQGINFSDYLIRLKLEAAAAMLVRNQSMKVTDIAATLGYSNISYFNKMFKERFGMTPTQYRLKSLSLH